MKNTNLKPLLEKVENYLKNYATYDEVVCLWNTYCEVNYMCDDRIEFMDDLNELFYDVKVSEFLKYINPRNRFDYSDDYFGFDGYGHLYSFKRVELFEHIDLNDLVEAIVKNCKEDYETIIDGELSSEISDFWESEDS